MRSPIWKLCSACAAHSTRSSSQIQRKFFPGRGCAVNSRGSINLILWSSPELRNAFEMASLPTATGKGAAVQWDDRRAIAGPKQVRSGGPGDRVARVQPEAVFEPGSEKELAAALHCADAAGLSVVPRGGGTKTSWGNPPMRADLILSMARLKRVIEHAWADLTVSVEAGCTFQRLPNTLSQHVQSIAIHPLLA